MSTPLCQSFVGQPAEWINMNTVPDPDGIGCQGLLDFTQWAYTDNMPTGPNGTNFSVLNKGDPYLGMVVNECEHSWTPPAYNGQNYIKIIPGNGDCDPEATGSGAPCPVIGNSIAPVAGCGGQCTYGDCPTNYFGSDSGHPWQYRDFDTELLNNKDDCGNTCFSLNFLKCCATPYNSPNRTQTCPPNLWAGSSKCQGDIFISPQNTNTCPVTNTPISVSGMQTWCGDPTQGVFSMDSGTCQRTALSGYCSDYINQLYALGDPGMSAVADGMVYQMLNSWIINFAGSDIETDPYTPNFISWCSQRPGLCDPLLKQQCANIERGNLDPSPTGTPNTIKLCGCFLSPSQYLVPGVVPPECDSICQLNATVNNGVPLGFFNSAQNGWVPKVCKQSSCVMSNLTIGLANTHSGPIDISQVCGGCGGSATCTCILDNVTIQEINSNINGGTNVTQNCSSCTFVDANGNTSTGPCSSSSGDDTVERYTPLPQSEKSKKDNFFEDVPTYVWILVGMAVVVILLFLYYSRR